MNSSRFKLAPALVLAAALLAAPASAHHSYAMYEQKEIKLQGTVKELQWTNPHIFLQVLVPDGKGGNDEWALEGGGPGQIGRQGWKFNSVKAGEKVTVGVAPLKDGQKGGALIVVIKADGSRLNGGPLARLDPDYKPSGDAQ